MQEQQHNYDWQLPPYKPLHVGTNLGYRSHLTLTPRTSTNQPLQLTEQPLIKSQKYHLTSKTILQHLTHAFCVYRKFQTLDFYELRDLNHNFLKIGITKLNTRSIMNQRLEGNDMYLERADLVFDSVYESANLLEAYEIREGGYHLILQNDTESIGFNSWFNFKVENTLPISKVYTFCIINMRKQSSLYRNGLLPMVFTKEKGWHRAGSRQHFFKNGLKRQVENREYTTLQWEYELGPMEEVQFASNIPYTVSDLHAFLSSIRALTKHVAFTRETLCYSYLNNRIQVLTVTDSQEGHAKKEVLLVGRVHPEETTSSYIIEGLIKFLLSDYHQSRQLLRTYKFHIVPMINPDGVVLGNSRCGALGKDLNRLWSDPKFDSEPEIFQLKKYIRDHRKKISFIIDLHSQIKKKSCYVYGVHSTEQPFFTRELPFIMSEVSLDTFSYRDCNFVCGFDKNNTARKNIWQSLKIPIFSYECSVCSMKDNRYFVLDDYWKLAKDFIKAFAILNPNTDPQYHQIFKKKKLSDNKMQKELILSKLKIKQENIEIGLRNQYSDSDTEPEEDYAVSPPTQQQRYNLSIQQLSNKLKIQANIERLLRFKHRQFANFSIQKERMQLSPPKIKRTSQQYQRIIAQMNRNSSKKVRYSPARDTPERKRDSFKYKKLELSSDIHPHGNLYTEMDSQRDRIRGIISKSRTEQKKIENFRIQRKGKLQKSMTLQGKGRRERRERILTLPDELTPEYLVSLKKNRKSNLIDAINVAKIWRQNILVSEFIDKPPLS